jgi:KUP system potassium uptake protein
VHTEQVAPPVTSPADRREAVRAAVVVGALGVVFGDIGTSPIYTVQTAFNPSDPHPVPVSTSNLFGVFSRIFWSVMIIVTVTYVLLVMRISNEGEGGIMALITLLRRWGGGHGRRGAVLLGRPGDLRRRAVLRRQHDHTGDIRTVRCGGFEDGRAEPGRPGRAHHGRDPRAAVRRATPRHRRGRAVVRPRDDCLVRGDRRVRCRRHRAAPGDPEGAVATYAVGFLAGHFGIAFFALAAIVLAVTGAEALYAAVPGGEPHQARTRGLAAPC